jgi:glycosyltransferase involved in cell wall biosynthesis
MSQRSNKVTPHNEDTRVRPLKVALVTSSLRLAGAEKQTVYAARALFQAGMDVRVFYLGENGHYQSVLRQLGIPLIQIYAANKPWFILASLTRALCRLRPQIVLVNQFGDLIHGGTAGRVCGALTLGGVRSDGRQELDALGLRTPWMLRLAHGFVANSCCARANLVSRGIKPQKIQVLTNVIDLRVFDARSGLSPRISLPQGRIIAAAVGRLHPCKRFDRFLEALALARRSEPGLAGVIAGADDGARTALQEKATALGLKAPDLTFLGECDNVPALLARAGLLVLTSEREGFPNVILEAMAARLPVITTPAGDASLIVHHDKTGMVVAGEDTSGMAASMVQLARSPAMRMKFGEAGRRNVEQDYDCESLASRLVAIFQCFARQSKSGCLLEALERDIPTGKPETLSGRLALDSQAA